MSESEKMSQRERSDRHKRKHPEGEARRKDIQRQRDALILIHVKRNLLYGYEIPALIDQDSDAFARVRAEYEATLSDPVEEVVE